MQGVGLDVADGDAASAEALDVARDLLARVQVHERHLGAARQLVVAAVQVAQQLQHKRRVLPPADQHRLHARKHRFSSVRPVAFVIINAFMLPADKH